MSDGFDELLERIRQQNHPDYGSLKWDGEQREVEIGVTFENGENDNGAIRERALSYLGSLTPAEREVVNIEVHLRDGRPVRATLRAKTGDLSPDRLVGLGYNGPKAPKNGVDRR